MTKSVKSAGILLYRRINGTVEVLLAHPGGPYWDRKDIGVWTIPKGLMDENESEELAARREMLEETGCSVVTSLSHLGYHKQPSGKIVIAFAAEDTGFDISSFESNLFQMEWPKNSGNMQNFPEIDRIEWFTLDIADVKILRGQKSILTSLMEHLND